MASLSDCVIAGAGPTGLTLALELLRRGRTVRIFDRSPGPRPDEQSRALGILPPTLTILEASGVTETLLSQGLKLERAEVFHKGKPLFSIDISRGGGRYPFVLSLPQGRTERILLAAVEALGGEVFWNTQVTGIDTSGANPALLVEKDGKTERVEGARIAGCDGVHSIVREELGISFEGDSIETPFSLADVKLKEPLPPGTPRIDLHDAGIIIQLPMPGDWVRLVSPLPVVHERPEIAASIAETAWISDFIITFRHVDRLQAGPVFLAGDAAHVHSPAGGRGMNTGIGDAAWLAWLIAEGREDEYEGMRLSVAKHVIDLTRRLTRMVAANGAMARTIRSHVLPVIMRSGFVQRQVASRILAHDMPHPLWIKR